MAFRGHFEHALDAKNRLTVPSKFRAALADGAVLARAFEPCVSVWVPSSWQQFTQNFLSSLNPFSEESRRLQRYFHAGSFDAELDSAGRLMIPPLLIEHAELKKEITVVGNQDSFEVWSRSVWQGYQDNLTKTILEDAEKIAARD